MDDIYYIPLWLLQALYWEVCGLDLLQLFIPVTENLLNIQILTSYIKKYKKKK